MPSGKVAIVFGPESSGLTNDQVQLCHFLIHIPTSEEYPALNLAQAVAICLYELRRAWLRREAGGEQGAEMARWEEQAHLFQELEAGLEKVRYLKGIRGKALMHALRHLIGRAGPSPMEVRLLFGLARQLQWVARQANLDTSTQDAE